MILFINYLVNYLIYIKKKAEINFDNPDFINELYKIFYSHQKSNWEYISKLYSDDKTNICNIVEFIDNIKKYFNIISQKYLNCIISSIKYTFLIYKKLNIEKNEYTKEEVEQIKNDLNDKYLRLFAEFDNYKRRVAKDI